MRNIGIFCTITGFLGIMGAFVLFVLMIPLALWEVITPDTVEFIYLKIIAALSPVALLLYVAGYLIGDWYDHEAEYEDEA